MKRKPLRSLLALLALLALISISLLVLTQVFMGCSGCAALHRPPVAQVLKSSQEPDAPMPQLTRPRLPKGAKWVVLIRFTAQVSPESAAQLVRYLDICDAAGVDQIVLEINTPGGEVNAGQEMARAIERERATVVCVVDGEAESMGFYLTQSCGVRLMTKRSVLMVHNPLFAGGAECRTEEDCRNLAEALRIRSAAMLEHETARLLVPREAVEEKIRGSREWFMGAQEALQVGAVDAIVDSVEDVLARLRAAR